MHLAQLCGRVRLQFNASGVDALRSYRYVAPETMKHLKTLPSNERHGRLGRFADDGEIGKCGTEDGTGS
jgi:hypothetical protein